MSIYLRREWARERLTVKSLHLKVKSRQLFEILPDEFSEDEFIDAFKQYFPCEWEDIVSYCKTRNNDNNRRKGKGLRTVPDYEPRQFLLKHRSHTRKKSQEFIDEERQAKADVLMRKAEKKKRQRKAKREANLKTVQVVRPRYVQKLIRCYFDQRKANPLDVNARYLILLEASHLKCNDTISFLNKVSACEKNDDLRLVAFYALQHMGENPWLARKRKGKKRLSQVKPIDIKKNPTELLELLSSHQHLLFQTYDVFVSHSSRDVKEIIQLKYELNRMGLVVYIDWVNDVEMLNRENQNENTWNALKLRMDQSKLMLYVMTDNSTVSSWTEREVNYFKQAGKRVVVYLPTPVVTEKPGYLSGCDIIKYLTALAKSTLNKKHHSTAK